MSGAHSEVKSYIERCVSREVSILCAPYHWPDSDGIVSAHILSALLSNLGVRLCKCVLYERPQYDGQFVMNILDQERNYVEFAPKDAYFVLLDSSRRTDFPKKLNDQNFLFCVDHHRIDEADRLDCPVFYMECGSLVSFVLDIAIREFGIPPSALGNRLIRCAAFAINCSTCARSTSNTTDLDRRYYKLLEELSENRDRIKSDWIDYCKKKTDFALSNIFRVIVDDLPSSSTRYRDKDIILGQLECSFDENSSIDLVNKCRAVMERVVLGRCADGYIFNLLDLQGRGTIMFGTEIDQNIISKLPVHSSPDGTQRSKRGVARKDILKVILQS